MPLVVHRYSSKYRHISENPQSAVSNFYACVNIHPRNGGKEGGTAKRKRQQMIPHAQEGSSMCARPICFSPLAATPSHARALAADSPGEDPLTDYTAPSFTQYKSPSRSLSSFILPPFTKTPSFSRTRNKGVFFESSVDAAIERKQKLDVLSHLPPEIAVKILCYLQPQDLCQ